MYEYPIGNLTNPRGMCSGATIALYNVARKLILIRIAQEKVMPKNWKYTKSLVLKWMGPLFQLIQSMLPTLVKLLIQPLTVRTQRTGTLEISISTVSTFYHFYSTFWTFILVKNSVYRCDVCQIVTTDQGGLDMHLLGKKHKKKLEAMKWVKVS